MHSAVRTRVEIALSGDDFIQCSSGTTDVIELVGSTDMQW